MGIAHIENKLKDIAGGSGGQSTETSTQLQRFDLTQLMPTVPLVKMNKKEEGTKNLFLIHPIEGGVASLRSLASLLNWSVHGLQCTPDAPHTSIPDLASHYLQKIRSVQPSGPVHIAGYSFGAVVAFELALQLEVLINFTILDNNPIISGKGQPGISESVGWLPLLRGGAHDPVQDEDQGGHGQSGDGSHVRLPQPVYAHRLQQGRCFEKDQDLILTNQFSAERRVQRPS